MAKVCHTQLVLSAGNPTQFVYNVMFCDTNYSTSTSEELGFLK